MMATFASMIESSKKINPKLSKNIEIQWVLYIYYSTQFVKFSIKVLINSSSKVNVMQPNFARKINFYICKTNVSTQKIDGSRLMIYRMVIALFQLDNKDKKSHFFKKTFLLANISIDVALKMFFLILSNIEVNFND